MARELQSRYEKDERGAYYEWRWEVHRILFSQSVLLCEGRIRVALLFACSDWYSKKWLSGRMWPPFFFGLKNFFSVIVLWSVL